MDGWILMVEYDWGVEVVSIVMVAWEFHSLKMTSGKFYFITSFKVSLMFEWIYLKLFCL